MNELKRIFIEGTAKAPQIDFHPLSGELILSGKSIPENAAKIYEPLLFWITDYIKSPKHTTNLRINLEYFNTATSLWIVKIIKELSKIEIEDSVLVIHVYLDIEDLESMDIEELKDLVWSLIGNVLHSKVSIGIKIYGTDNEGKILRESTVII